MQSEHQCFTGASGRRGWEPIVLQRDQCSTRRKMVSDGKVTQDTSCFLVCSINRLTVRYVSSEPETLAWKQRCESEIVKVFLLLSCSCFYCHQFIWEFKILNPQLNIMHSFIYLTWSLKLEDWSFKTIHKWQTLLRFGSFKTIINLFINKIYQVTN